MNISLCQISPKLSRKNIQAHMEYIDKAVADNQEIVCFPELSLNGYNLQDAVRENFFDDLKELVNKSTDIDIVLGCVLKDKSKYYNSALYLSHGKIVHIHNKNILPNYGMFEEQRFFDAGDEVQTFDTKFGLSMMLICEDVWDKSILAQVRNSDVKNLFILSASPTRGFLSTGLEIEDKWDEIVKDISKNKRVIYINRVGFEDGMGFWGGSRIYEDTRLIKKLDLFEELYENISL